MNTLRSRGLELLMVVLLMVTTAVTFGQLTAKAQRDPGACGGLDCTAQEDCGSKCFCNRPTGKCYVN